MTHVFQRFLLEKREKNVLMRETLYFILKLIKFLYQIQTSDIQIESIGTYMETIEPFNIQTYHQLQPVFYSDLSALEQNFGGNQFQVQQQNILSSKYFTNQLTFNKLVN